MEKIYISGKITGLDNYAEVFEQAEKTLTEQGYEVINPTKLNHSNHNQSWESFMKIDLAEMLKCDAIYMLKNWRESKGAITEGYLAHTVKMKIIFEK